jgi:hypothetical protein
MDEFKKEQEEAPEQLAMRRFQEVAQNCLEIAGGLRSREKMSRRDEGVRSDIVYPPVS